MNQLRRCICGKFWQTHERGCRLWRCPKCGSTKKDHEILMGHIFTSHKINPNEYSELLLEITWHETFSVLEGYFIKNKYCNQCKYEDKNSKWCDADLPYKHNKVEFGNKVCGFFKIKRK